MSDLFDDMDETTLDEALKPFHVIEEKNNEKEKFEWLTKVKSALMEQAKTRTSKQRMHLSWYRGISPQKHERRREYNSTRRLSKINKFIVNHLFDLTETKVSQMTRLKPAVEVLPANDEWEDRAAAKVTGFVIKHLWDQNNVDFLIQQMHRHTRIFGESYAFTLWDKNKGDLHPAYVEAQKIGLKEMEIDGETVDLSKPVKTGDICYELEVPWRVLLQRNTCFDKVEYLIRVKVQKTEDLRIEYPNKKDKIQEQDDLRIFDIDNLSQKFVEKHTLVYELYHIKQDQYASMQNGKYIKFTEKGILEESDLPFSHGKLPIVRLTDQDIPDVLNGVSRYETVGPIQNMYNNIQTLLAKNIYLTAHPKWMMPRGACKLEALGNDAMIAQYQGPVAPSLAQIQSNPPEVYAYAQSLVENMQTIYGSHGISRGEVPKGITAASALQFLNELENERASTDIAKHGFLVKDLAKMTIAVTGDYYDVNDGRMVRIVGEGNKFLIRHFDAANLNKNYDIRFDNSTGLPESKAAKIQRLMDIMQRNPQLFSPERWEELLDLGDTNKAISMATEALRAADSENEDLISGIKVGLPEEYEDHIQHWMSHSKQMQSRSFKEEASNEVQGAFKDHVYWTEELMLEKAAKNPLFQAKLAELKLFPLFFHDNDMIPQSMEHQQAMVQGQSNKGDAVTGQIPGQDIESVAEANQ